MSKKRPRNIEPEVELVVDGNPVTLPLAALTLEHLEQCSPVRTFRWHRGQRHFPGWYWAATEGRHVMYESRLELARLRLADFDNRVCSIRSQPFRLNYVDGSGTQRRQIPDYAITLVDSRVLIVNVKPAHRLEDPRVRASLEGSHATLNRHGFDTEIWSTADPQLMAAVQFLAGYRWPQLFNDEQRANALAIVRVPMTVRAAEQELMEQGIDNPRPLLLHLLWRGELRADLSRNLDLDTVVEQR